jgi:hypothetical protein
MPELEKHPPALYDPLQPYHWEFDNLPLQSLIDRDRVINDAVDINSAILRGTAGTQGTLANRLNQSIDEDGSLKTTALDDASHNIGQHTDGVGDDAIDYVRMKDSERDKLTLISDEATNVEVHIETPSNIVVFDEGPIIFEPSSTVTWQVLSGNSVRANLGFPVESAHRHYYDLEPITSDYTSFQVNSVSTPYVEDSLRVYINGVRLGAEIEVYVPGNLPTDTWTLIKATPTHTAGTFILSNTITSDDIIRVDFDVALT